jgi:hypothetical protein
MSDQAPTAPVVGRGGAIVVLATVVVVYLLLVYAAYRTLTSQVPGGNDFYPRWRGTRALLLDGQDPYSEEVTLQIQKDMYGRPARDDEDQVAFAYPLYVALLILPFSLLPYPLAQAFWLSALILTALATLVVVLRTLDWNPHPVALVGLAVWFVLFYPTARSVILGQISIVVLVLVALALWALKDGRSFLAGCLLGLSTVKPQLVFLIVPFLLLVSSRRRNYRAVAGFLSVVGILLVVTSIILPTWIPSFIAGLTSYRSYTSIYRGGASPLGYLVGALVPSPMSGPGTLAVSLGLIAWVAYTWFGALTGRVQASLALSLTIVATLLLPGETGTTNQVLLLLPLVQWLHEWRKQRWLAGLASSVLLIAPWLLFIGTLKGDLEHPMMVLPLPIATLLMFLWTRREDAAGQLVTAA